MTAILTHFSDTFGDQKKENFMNQFIFKGIKTNDRFDIFIASLDCYINIINTLKYDPPFFN